MFGRQTSCHLVFPELCLKNMQEIIVHNLKYLIYFYAVFFSVIPLLAFGLCGFSVFSLLMVFFIYYIFWIIGGIDNEPS